MPYNDNNSDRVYVIGGYAPINIGILNTFGTVTVTNSVVQILQSLTTRTWCSISNEGPQTGYLVFADNTSGARVAAAGVGIPMTPGSLFEIDCLNMTHEAATFICPQGRAVIAFAEKKEPV